MISTVYLQNHSYLGKAAAQLGLIWVARTNSSPRRSGMGRPLRRLLRERAVRRLHLGGLIVGAGGGL